MFKCYQTFKLIEKSVFILIFPKQLLSPIARYIVEKLYSMFCETVKTKIQSK